MVQWSQQSYESYSFRYTDALFSPLIQDLVLNGLTQWKSEDGTVLVTQWENLVEADFSRNSIREIDDSVVSN